MTNGKFVKYDYFKGLEKIGYPDYHNHLGGVLPYKKLRDFYQENYSVSRTNYGYECSRLSVGDKMDFKKFESGVGLFLRTTYHLLVEKYDFTKRSSAPMRGAHAVMLGVFYLFLFAAKAGIISDGDMEYVKKNLKGPEEIEPLLKKYLSKCYVWLRSAKNVPRECKSVAKRAFMNYVRATRYTPFDDGYVGRSAYLAIFDDKKRIGVEKYGMRSLEWLYKEEKTRYVEMSQPQDKIPGGAKSKGYSWCKWLLLTANHRELLAGQTEFRSTYWKELVAALEIHPYYVGIDLAGPEGYWYKSRNTQTFVKKLLPDLQKQAEIRQRKYKAPNVVFRPHVGEGSSILDKGASLVELSPVAFLKGAIEGALRKRAKEGPVKGVTSDFLDWLDKDYVARLGKTGEVRDFKIYKKKDLDLHVKKMSINNIQVFIDALRAAKYPGEFPNVIVRFGHVTHVTKEQAENMAELGIRADVNLGSNLRTGSLTFIEDLAGAKKRRAVFGDWNKDWASLVDRGHGLQQLLKSGVKAALGSDGQGVEITSIETEYHLAEEYLKDLKIGKQITDDKFWNYTIALIKNAREMIGPS